MVSAQQKRVRVAADAARGAGIVIAPLRPTREKALALRTGEYGELDDDELSERTADLLVRKGHGSADRYRASGFRYELRRTRAAGGPSIVCVELEDPIGTHARMEARWEAAWQSTESRADLWARITASRAEARPSGGTHFLVAVSAEAVEGRRPPRVHRAEAGQETPEMFAEVLTESVIAATSYDVHPSGEVYELVQSVAWDDLTELSTADYDLLAEVFSELDEAPGVGDGAASMSAFPGLSSRARAARAQYDAQHFEDPTRAAELLVAAGWGVPDLSDSDHGVRISRPGGSGRTSGILGGLDGYEGCVKIFTTSVPELPEGFYTPFALLTYLGTDADGAPFSGDPELAAAWLDRTGQVDITPRSMSAATRPHIYTGSMPTDEAVEALMQAIREARDPALGEDIPMVVMQTSAKGDAEHPVILRPHGQRVAVTSRQDWLALSLAVAQPARSTDEEY